jgi:hypothetical protein
MKDPLLPHLLHSPVGGGGQGGSRGGGGASYGILKICFKKKQELHLNYHQKHIENDIFIEKLWNKKVFKDILRGIFDFYKKFLLKASLTYGCLCPQAVRIRVKYDPNL